MRQPIERTHTLSTRPVDVKAVSSNATLAGSGLVQNRAAGATRRTVIVEGGQ